MIITISGMPGSGKTSVALFLAKKFRLKYYSVGTIMRSMAREKGISVTEMNKRGEKDKKIDRQIDDYQIRLGKRVKNAIFDGRLSFHFVPKSVRILLQCDPETGAKRIFSQKRKNENYSTYREAIAYIKKRSASERLRFKRYYKVDINSRKNFDIVYDTSHNDQWRSANEILRMVETVRKNKAKNAERRMTSGNSRIMNRTGIRRISARSGRAK